MYYISTIVITFGLLLFEVSKVSSIQCVFCEGSTAFSKCASAKKMNTTLCHPKYPYCSIETREINGKLNLVRRRCSNGTLTLTHNPKMHLLNPKTNVTLCVFQQQLICASLCDKDFCNGLSNRSSLVRADFKLLKYSLLLFYLFYLTSQKYQI